MIEIDAILLVGAVVLIAAIIAARIGARVGLPSLLLFLGLGMVMGESGIGISFDNAEPRAGARLRRAGCDSWRRAVSPPGGATSGPRPSWRHCWPRSASGSAWA